ncbi:MAG TPA: hypothetical protein VGC45_00915 [Gryllotalpicola sp.]
MAHLKSKTLLGGLAAAAALVTVSAFGIPAANADPLGAPTDYVAAGSDTIQSLYDGFANGYFDDTHTFVAGVPDQAGHKLLSFDAFGSSTIQTKVNGPVFNRPGGSGAGRQALSLSYDSALTDKTLQQTDDAHHSLERAVDIARSSGQPPANLRITEVNPVNVDDATANQIGGTNDNLTYVPLARDAVDVAIGSEVSGLTDITSEQLKAIYNCQDTDDVTIDAGAHEATISFGLSSVTVHIQLPQPNSGTRQFFMAALGANTNAPGACIDTNPTLQENNAAELDSHGIIPFSAAQYIAQKNGIATDTGVTGITLLTVDRRAAVATVGGKAQPVSDNSHPTASPLSTGLYGNTGTAIPAQDVANPTAPVTLARDVYSVVPTSEISYSQSGGHTVVDGTTHLPTTVTADNALGNLVANVLPTQSGAITTFGFLTLGFAGQPADFLHSSWELP